MADVRLEERGGGVEVLWLDRPAKLNALGDSTVAELGRLLDRVAASSCRALVLTGSGKAFCAGFDLALAGDAPGSDAGETQAWMHRQEAFSGLVTRFRALPQPIIAAVNGAAAGGGLALALAADIRIAARTARFSAAFVRIGMSGCDMGVSWLLPRCVGFSRSNELLLTGRAVDGEEAARIGLVSEVVEDERLLPRALELAGLVAANSPFGVWMTKRGIWANVEAGSLQAAIELENRTQILARTTGDMARLTAGWAGGGAKPRS
jgi:enoyl-CoA hydratase